MLSYRSHSRSKLVKSADMALPAVRWLSMQLFRLRPDDAVLGSLEGKVGSGGLAGRRGGDNASWDYYSYVGDGRLATNCELYQRSFP